MNNHSPDTFIRCKEKQKALLDLFKSCKTPEERYLKIIELGKTLEPFPEEKKLEKNRVSGCQSTMYLHAEKAGNTLHFAIASDALISAGLASLLLAVYNDEAPETILKCPPDYLKELNINASLSPSRANGLYHIHLRMQQEALKALLP
jgi:cysteine desulfuration protein SufE